MAEKASKRIRSGGRSCNSKRSTAGLGARVVHISNPTIMVEMSASEFRAIVQFFTGRKRSSTSSTEHQEINSYYDAHYCPQVKAPKLLLEDELDSLNDIKYLDSAMTDDNVTAVNDSCNNIDHQDVTIFEELEVLPLEKPDYIVSPQVFDTVESLPETTNILFDIFSPPIIF